jgi:head-tail adaptor
MGFRGGAGALNQRCTFEKKTDVVSERGGPGEIWRCAFHTSCAVGPLKGDEDPKVGARNIIVEKRSGQTILIFRIRYRGPNHGITKSTHRILYKGQVWNITDVREIPAGATRELEIDAITIE